MISNLEEEQNPAKDSRNKLEGKMQKDQLKVPFVFQKGGVVSSVRCC
jgi:hypothetical protein